MIGVVNIGLGNTLSVIKAIEFFNGKYELAEHPSGFDRYEKLIFPGVGAYDRAIDKLDSEGLLQPIKDYLESGRPYLGICLGMQLLSSYGEEGAGSKGFGFIDGTVKVLPVGNRLKLPHIGWNNVSHAGAGLFSDVSEDADFYFVHSYYFDLVEDVEYATTSYAIEFPSYIRKKNAYGVQFHPEKSQKSGLTLIKNFIEKC